jgi:hypothetical protein
MNQTTKQPADSQGQKARAERFRQPRVRLGAVVAIALAAGFIAWLVVGGNNDNTATTTQGQPRSSGTGPAAISRAGLVSLSSRLNQPIYWAGPRTGYTYELTRTTDGRTYVRYLPPGIKVGDKRANYLIVVTYPYRKALRALEAVKDGRGHQIPGGGLAVVQDGYPQSVHVAYPGENYQVEVYDPSPKRSLAVALSGSVRPAS